MQTAQMNSPRFNYPTPASAVTNVPHTLDDFRPVHGSYSGSFSGKSSHPIWIAVGMIAVVASIAVGVNMYSESHSAKIETAVSAPNLIVPKTPVAPTAPAIEPAPVEAPAAKEMAAPDALRTPPANSVIAKPAPVVTKKVAPIPIAPASAVVTPQPEVVPPLPAIVEPAPTPPPIVIEPPVVPAPTPVAPPVEPTKL